MFRNLGRVLDKGPSFRVETSCWKQLLEEEELCCSSLWLSSWTSCCRGAGVSFTLRYERKTQGFKLQIKLQDWANRCFRWIYYSLPLLCMSLFWWYCASINSDDIVSLFWWHHARFWWHHVSFWWHHRQAVFGFHCLPQQCHQVCRESITTFVHYYQPKHLGNDTNIKPSPTAESLPSRCTCELNFKKCNIV